MRRGIVLAAVAAALAAGCGGRDGDAADPPLEVEGRVVAVEEEDGRVVGFTVEDAGGNVDIRIAGDVDYGFDLAHLHEHEESGDPVRVALEERDGELYAVSIVDA